jgi:thioredoxin 1
MENQQVKKITSQEFVNNVVRAKANAVVNLFTQWSGASHLLDFVLSDVASQYRDQLEFYQVDLDTEPSLSDTYRVELVPTLLFFRNGKLVDKLAGLNHRQKISERIENLVTNQ